MTNDKMTSEERLCAALAGREVDRVPYSPFLAYFWDMQPPEIQQAGELAFLLKIGADPLFRGHCKCHRLVHSDTQIEDNTTGNERVVRITTPVGVLETRYIYTAISNSWFLNHHPVQTVEDLRTLAWLYHNTRAVEDYTDLNTWLAKINHQGVLLPTIGSETKSCFQSLLEHWIGTEQLIYLLADEPEEVLNCLKEMQRVALETAKIAAKAPVPGFITFEDSSTTNINPQMFRDYIVPELNAWADVLHEEGKVLVHHACGHLQALLPEMGRSHVDFIESISPPPTGNVTVAEIRETLPKRIGLIGGIEPTALLHDSSERIEATVQELLRLNEGHAYILANSDSCPPDVAVERLQEIGTYTRQFSQH